MLCALCVAAAARAAGPTLTDDFESGSLSRWSIYPLGGGVSAAPNPASAHRGDAGVRITDNDAATTGGQQLSLARDLTAVTGDYHVRFWYRMPAVASSVSGFTIAQLLTPGSSVVAAANVLSEGSRIGISGGANGDFTQSIGNKVMGDGQWHLVELSVLRLGTVNGQRRLWVDGVLETEATNLDWMTTSYVPDKVTIGEPFAGNKSFTGVLDYDDFRSGPTRWGNEFVLDVVGTVTQGRCVEATLRLTTVHAPPSSVANLTEDTRVALGSADGKVDFFTSLQCLTALPAVTVPSGSQSAKVWFKSRGAGAQTLVATHPDYLRGETVITTAAPTAVITSSSDTLPAGGGTVTLSSTGSTPAAGFTLTGTHWRQTRGPTGVELPTGASIDVPLKVPGTYTFELTVEDSAGGVSPPALTTVEVAGEVYRPEGATPGCAAVPAGLFVALAALLLGRRRAP
ncbi:MAG: hypothetical protein IPJ65_03335 [Archangiaceae bacterium]|nr:hypothetical protein [Archangiaceae bacterium]